MKQKIKNPDYVQNFMINDKCFVNIRNKIDELNIEESYDFLNKIKNSLLSPGFNFNVLVEYSYNKFRKHILNLQNIKIIEEYNIPRLKDESGSKEDVLDKEGYDLKVLDSDGRIRFVQCKNSKKNMNTITFDHKMIIQPDPYYLLHMRIGNDLKPYYAILLNWHSVCDKLYSYYLKGKFKEKLKSHKNHKYKYLYVRFRKYNNDPFFFIDVSDLHKLKANYEVIYEK